MTGIFRSGLATDEHWGLAARDCLRQIGPVPPDANLGFVYATADFAESLSSIVTYLREVTGIDCWLGGIGYGVFGAGAAVRGGPGLAVMTGCAAPGGFRPFDRFDPSSPDLFLSEHGAWLSGRSGVTALVHGNPRTPRIAAGIRQLSGCCQGFLVGGLTADTGGAAQICGRVGDAELSGVLLDGAIPVATGLTQACSPIGSPHRVTGAIDNVIMELDGRPALQALKEDCGDIIARDLKRAAGYIHVAQPVAGSDRREDFVVHGLVGIDPRRGWLAITGGLESGDQLQFVRHHSETALSDLRRMLERLAGRLAGRTIRGGLYISSDERSTRLFRGVPPPSGGADCETGLIHDTLGSFPLIGFSTNGEICHDRLHSFAGILVLFL